MMALAPLTLRCEEPDLPYPFTPATFHELECARLRQTIHELESRPLLSTQADFDALYYHLTLDIRNFSGRIVWGNTLITVRSLANDLDELILDLCSSLTVDSVIGNGSLGFTLSNNLLTVALDRTYLNGEELSVRVYYHGTPCQTNLFTTFTYQSRQVQFTYVPTIFTLSEPYGARDWWPSKNVPNDKADSVRVSIIVADTLTATSNGVLESLTALPPSSRMFTWVERYPISTYLVSIAATNYTSFTNWYIAQNGDSVPIVHYSYPEKLAAAQVSWNPLPAMMTFNAQLFGEYPFVAEKYGHTMMSYGSAAMEHQCNTSYDRSLTDGYHTYDYIVQHELAHQWWGDDVTLASWTDIWLNEGFASYSEALWVEHVNGYGALRTYLFAAAGLRVTDPSGPVYNPTTMFDGNTVYNKGGWIVHMLRGAIRDDSVFFAALREYRARHSYGNATTQELLSDISDVAGFDLSPYVHTYLYRTNRPVFDVSFGSAWRRDAWQTVVRIHQTQTNPDTTFCTRLDLRLTNGADSLRFRVDNREWNERYYFALPFPPAALTVDPDDWVLKQVFSEPLPLTILTPSLADGWIGSAYGDTLLAIGGTGEDRHWSLLSAELPGISLSPDGVLSGIPEVDSLFSLRVMVEDFVGGTDSLNLTLRIRRPLPPPEHLTALYQSEAGLLSLRWSSVVGADSYRVFRGSRFFMPDLELLLTTSDTFALDSLAYNPLNPDSVIRRFYYVISVGGDSLR